jgi:hypothetical protein
MTGPLEVEVVLEPLVVVAEVALVCDWEEVLLDLVVVEVVLVVVTTSPGAAYLTQRFPRLTASPNLFLG